MIGKLILARKTTTRTNFANTEQKKFQQATVCEVVKVQLRQIQDADIDQS